jgi:hypothetical protein
VPLLLASLEACCLEETDIPASPGSVAASLQRCPGRLVQTVKEEQAYKQMGLVYCG